MVKKWLLRRRRDALIRSLPLRSPIFLPTDKVPLPEAVAGLEKVKALYEEGLEQVHRPRLRDLREAMRHRDRCFVIGNGPSLNQTDLSLLANEVTFAVNGFFLKASELGWSPTIYVVEDHLVAEDRADEINAIHGPIKMFPANLAYCLDADCKCIYFDHRPRISYPDGFDFSMEADRVTYAGCTVTFTCLQLAAFLGFRNIYLVGVDADYAIPADVQSSYAYGVDVLDMPSDDPNHFDPNYFGKGFRWHDPQVDNMLAAYREAKLTTDHYGVKIINAGVGGKLEVFPRVELESLFDDARAGSDAGTHPQAQSYDDAPTGAGKPVNPVPRIAIIDETSMGDGTATGELKSNLFGDWDESRLLSVFSMGRTKIGVRGAVPGVSLDGEVVAPDRALELIETFRPECILYRPTPGNQAFHELAMRYLQLNPTPLVTWVMDDWPARLRRHSPDQYTTFDADLRWLFDRAHNRLLIGSEMAEEFEKRYSESFVPLANGVDLADWPLPSSRRGDDILVRYAGALARDMTYDSVLRVAKAVEKLSQEGLSIRFEINTRPVWAEDFSRDVRGLRSCMVSTEPMTAEEYRSFLQDADILLIAYNFDQSSKEYVRYSLANKLPECLASGRVPLLHGPTDVATVSLVNSRLPALVVSEPDVDCLLAWFRRFTESREHRDELAVACRRLAKSDFSLRDRRELLKKVLRQSADAAYAGPLRYFREDESAQLDEPTLIARVVGGGVGQIDSINVDAEKRGLDDLRQRLAVDRTPAAVYCRFGISASDGIDWKEAAWYLLQRGYSVFVSEWYPEKEDRADRCWRSLRSFPCDLYDETGRRALLAFREPVRVEEVSDALDWVVKVELKALAPNGPASARTFRWSYVGFAEAIRDRSQRLFRACQLIMWLIRSVWSRPARAVALVVCPALAFAAAAITDAGLMTDIVVVALGVAAFGLYVVLAIRDFFRFRPPVNTLGVQERK